MSCKCHDHDRVIGRLPYTFLPGGMRGQPPGAAGNTIAVDFPFTYIGDHRYNDRLGWDTKFSSNLILDWYSPDGNNPYIGPSSWSITGTPTLNQKTPWHIMACSNIESTYFNGGSGYEKTPTGFNITTNDDIFIAMQIFMDPIHLYNAVSYQFFVLGIIGTGSIALVKHSSAPGTIWARIQGDTTVYPTVPTSIGWSTIVLTIRRGGVSNLYVNSNKGSVTTPTGNLFATDSCKIAKGAGYTTYKGNINRIVVAKGQDLLTNWTDTDAQIFTDSMNGLQPRTYTHGTLSRSSSATKAIENKYFIYSDNSPCAGDLTGYLTEHPVTNKVYLNYNPTVTSGLTTTGGMTLTIIANDATALAAAAVDLTDFGPAVFRVQNTTGSTQYVYATPQCGNTNAHSLSVFARYITGSNVKLGLYDQVGTAFSQGTAISDNYTRTLNPNLTPLATASWALEIPNNAHVYFTVQQNEEYWVCTNPILNNLTASTVTRSAHDFDTNYTINNTKSTIRFKLKTLFSGNVGASCYIFGIAMLYILSGNNFIRTWDGTNQAIVTTVNVCDGNWHNIELSWNTYSAKQKLTVDGVSNEAAYDGSWGAATTLHIGSATSPLYAHIKDFTILEN